jgi:hypothetical protein
MLHKLTYGIAAVLAAALVCAPTSAREQKERLLYDVMFGGLHIADVVVSLDQSPTSFDSTLEMRTRGVAEAFSDFRANIKSTGAFADAHKTGVAPSSYARTWMSEKIATEMTMTFDPTTGLAQTSAEKIYNPATGEPVPENELPWNNKRQKIKPVPENLRVGVLDPVTAFVAARHHILIDGKKEVRVPVYDGRRRYDIVSTRGEAKNYTIRGKEQMLIPVVSKLEPVFGFDAEQEENMRQSESKTLFTTDARAVPVQVVISTDLFSSVMNLVSDCSADPTPCNAVASNETGPAPAQQQGQAP